MKTPVNRRSFFIFENEEGAYETLHANCIFIVFTRNNGAIRF